MSASSEEWEMSKENIQPLQHGRKPDVLKVALASHPDQLLQQQHQVFENELRSYSGNDPLSVWYGYINWVEQNFVKGGKEGHVERLIEQCLTTFKDSSQYHNDHRFIEIWLKLASGSGKPTEVYNYMYSHKIGCQSAMFYISWSWELEQLANLKKADEVLSEGIRRQANPLDKLKLYRSEFEIRVMKSVKMVPPPVVNMENSRSAFSVLKPLKKNVAPSLRVGESESCPLIVRGRQPLTKSETSSKVPFKIFDSENIPPSLPLQSDSATPFPFYSDNVKENDKKPSQWNKVKLKQAGVRKQPGAPNFPLHCDEEAQPLSTPRNVPKVSSVLRAIKDSPKIAIFESPDPKRRAMYDKARVYGGAKEFSLEEIRATAWFKEQKEKQRELEKDRQITLQKQKLQEQQEHIKQLQSLVVQLKNNKVSEVEAAPMNKNGSEDNHSLSNTTLPRDLSTSKYISSNEASCMLRDLYNGTLMGGPHEDTAESILRNETSQLKAQNADMSYCNLQNKPAINFVLYQDPTENIHQPNTQQLQKLSDDHRDGLCHKFSESHLSESNPQEKPAVPFVLYQDPTESVTRAKREIPDGNDIKVSNKLQGQISDVSEFNIQEKPAFVLYQDPTENIHPIKAPSDIHQSKIPRIVIPASSVSIPAASFSHDLKEKHLDSFPSHGKCSDKENEPGDDDVENIPPKGYVQDTTKREMSGILELSKNVPFEPLELQELDEEEEKEEEIYSNEHNRLQNETLIPPCNTEQFNAEAFLSSTPRTTMKKMPPPDVKQESYKSGRAITADEENRNPQRMRDQSTFRGLPVQLSVIMETSKECYKSSSSSGSSGNATSQFEPYFSSERSGIQRNLSRTDHNFKEPKLVSFTRDFSLHTNSHKNAFPPNNDVSGRQTVPVPHKVQEAIIKNDMSRKWLNDVQDSAIHISDINPFEEALTTSILKSLCLPHDFYKNVQTCNRSLWGFKGIGNLQLANVTYEVQNLVSEGAYGKVYKACRVGAIGNDNSDKNLDVALKVCKNANDWELYICTALLQRLEEIKDMPDVRLSVMKINSAVKFTQGIVLATEFAHYGTLLNLVNFYKQKNSVVPEVLTLYLTLEILQTVEHIHRCKIVHGDMKPDNVLLRDDLINFDLPSALNKRTSLLMVIDFGRAIDLSLLDEGVCFNTVVEKNMCPEMRDGKPWVFQPDWYGVLNCVHVLLFSDYMRVRKNKQGRWEIENKIRRYWEQTIWTSLFDELLNIPACYKQPDIAKYVTMIGEKLKNKMQSFELSLHRLVNSFEQDKS